MGSPYLELKDLRVNYGNVEALHAINIVVNKGEIVTILGANGDGKTTTLLSISGLLKPVSGSITFEGETISNLASHEIVKRGITQSPEGRRVFGTMTVLENLELGAYTCKDRTRVGETLKWIYDLFPRLKERQFQLAGTLSGGEQQMLAVGRALMSNPEVIMLDEPSLGLAPLLVKEIFTIIKKINELGKTILLIEQNAFAALSIAHYAYILETGSVVLEGPGIELLHNPEVKKAYLGG